MTAHMLKDTVDNIRSSPGTIVEITIKSENGYKVKAYCTCIAENEWITVLID